MLLENAHGRVVGAATVSVSLASLDAGLRKCLGAGAPVQQLRLSGRPARRRRALRIPSPVMAVRVRCASRAPASWTWRGPTTTSHDAPPSTETLSPPSPRKSPGAFSPSNRCAAEATLVFAGATVAAFDDKAKAALN